MATSASNARGWVLLAVVLIGQTIALYLPGTAEVGLELFPHADKVVHVFLFATPALLLRILTRSWWPILALLAYAPISELVQHRWVPHRSGDPMDLLADFAGVALGVAVAGWLRARWSRTQGADRVAE